jgi:hypothetical protein
MRDQREATLAEARRKLVTSPAAGDTATKPPGGGSTPEHEEQEQQLDPDTVWRETAINAFRDDDELQKKIRADAIPWGAVKGSLQQGVPEDAFPDVSQWAYDLVRPALDAVYGVGNWTTEQRPRATGSGTTVWVSLKGV